MHESGPMSIIFALLRCVHSPTTSLTPAIPPRSHPPVPPLPYCSGGRLQLFPGDPYFPRFTAALGNMSSKNKQRRLLADVAAHVHASGHCYADVTQVGGETRAGRCVWGCSGCA